MSRARPTHTSRVYERELGLLHDKLRRMGELGQAMIRTAATALASHDAELARGAIPLDRKIDEIEREIDELALKILAKRQPVASDLRFVTASMKIVTDLERVGDLCVHCCERIAELGDEASPDARPELVALADEVGEVLSGVLSALLDEDADAARAALDRDDEIDAHYARIFESVLDVLARDPTAAYSATRVQSIAKYLERIADHAMNIAEAVVFFVEGKDIRHGRHALSDAPEQGAAATYRTAPRPPR